MFLQRLRSEFRFAVVAICGVLAASIVLPFGIYRLATGDLFIGVMDLLFAGLMLGISLFAWRSADTRRAGMLGAVLTTAWLAVMAGHTGPLALHWSHSIFVWNFFVAPRVVAIGANGLLVLSLLLRPQLFESALEVVSFGASALLINIIAGVVAWRGERQRLALERLATKDVLTGIGNRRLLDLELGRLCAGFQVGTPPHAIALLDLDHFKQVNDRAGHEAGDQVLREFVDIVATSARRFDRLYRVGGEEFVLLIPAPDETAVAVVLARIQQGVRQHLRQGCEAVTVSIGATMLEPGDSIASCMGRADRALYEAKRSGRDRTVLHGGRVDRQPTASHQAPMPA